MDEPFCGVDVSAERLLSEALDRTPRRQGERTCVPPVEGCRKSGSALVPGRFEEILRNATEPRNGPDPQLGQQEIPELVFKETKQVGVALQTSKLVLDFDNVLHKCDLPLPSFLEIHPNSIP